MEKNDMVRLPNMIHMLVCFLFLLASFALSEDFSSFNFIGFKDANLTLDGFATITTNGLLRLTNNTEQTQAHAFYSSPFQFRNSSNGGNTTITSSFSASFVFAIIPEYPGIGGTGIVFVVSKSKTLPGSLQGSYFGLFNKSSNGNSSNQIMAVELDTIPSTEFGDIDNNHVGIDINGLESINSSHAKYFINDHGDYKNLTLISGLPMQVWVEYDGLEKQLDVTIAPLDVPKPNIPLLSTSYDLSPIISDSMNVGFSSSTGPVFNSHYILGWSFKMNGKARALDLSNLPKLPKRKVQKDRSKILTIGLLILVLVFLSVMSYSSFYVIRRKKKFEEVLDDWELSYVPHRFSYKDLYIVTKGFRDTELLGIGGFGRVYKGVLPNKRFIKAFSSHHLVKLI